MQSTLNNKTNPKLLENTQGAQDTQTRNSPPKRSCFRSCSHLPCSIQGYRISSLDVIERWSLCYHLGCVITCLAKAGLEQSSQSPQNNCEMEAARLEDLKKAQCYLARELSLPQKCHLIAIGEQPFTTEAVLEDWQLSSSFHLSETLYHLKASKSPSMREESLREALKHLSAEIAAGIQTLKDDINETTHKQDRCFEGFTYSLVKTKGPELALSESGGNRVKQPEKHTNSEEKGGKNK